jgi:hypothetical protein
MAMRELVTGGGKEGRKRRIYGRTDGLVVEKR